MKVILKRPLYMGGVLYKRGLPAVDIPESFRDVLPPDAKVLDAKVKTEKPVEAQPSLKDFDEERANSDAETVVQNKAHKAVGKK